jgi:hypothetical protein
MSESPISTPASGIPTSEALSEASPASISELFSRDPEGFSTRDIQAIVEVLRAQRLRFEAAEAAGGKKPKPITENSLAKANAKARSAVKTLALPVGTGSSPEELGL